MYFILVLAVLVQLTVLNYIKILGSKPDLVLIAVVFFGLFSGAETGLEAGVFGGIMCDLFSLDFFGINALVLGLTGITAGFLSAKVFKESKKTGFLLVFFLTIFSMWLHYTVAMILARSSSLTFSEYFFKSVLFSAFYTAAVSVPIFLKMIDIFELKEAQGFL